MGLEMDMWKPRRRDFHKPTLPHLNKTETTLTSSTPKAVQTMESTSGELYPLIQGPTAPVGGEFVGIRHRSIFGSREPGVPRDVVAMA